MQYFSTFVTVHQLFLRVDEFDKHRGEKHKAPAITVYPVNSFSHRNRDCDLV